jgi:hypothetical protein
MEGKNNNGVNWSRINQFNDFIARLILQEMDFMGVRYT